MLLRIIVLLSAILSTNLSAEPLYLHLTYDRSTSDYPADRNWFEKLLSDQERTVYLVISLAKVTGNETVLLVPPTIMEYFYRTDDRLRRETGSDLLLLDSQFITDNDQVQLTVQFIAVAKTQAGAFVGSLKAMGTAYVAANATPAASQLLSSAMEAIEHILLDNRDLFLQRRLGVPTDQTHGALTLYFDDGGNMTRRKPSNDGTSTVVSFTVRTANTMPIDFQHAFSNQAAINSQEIVAFSALAAADVPTDRKARCQELRTLLKKRFSNKHVDDLIAIAVNDISWPQDETRFYCIHPDDALRYRRQHGLRNVAKCGGNACINTKTVLLMLEGGADQDMLKTVVNGDIDRMSCKSETQFKRLFSWSDIRSVPVNPETRAYNAYACLHTR